MTAGAGGVTRRYGLKRDAKGDPRTRPEPRNCNSLPKLIPPCGALRSPLGGIIRARIFEAGPVQEKCEGVSSYGLWGLCARTCARMLSLERMLASARFSATAQLGRVCKKSVRPPGRGVRGGSLSKKLRLNRPQTGVRKVRGRFPCPWPHFRGSGCPVLRPWRRCNPVCTRDPGYTPLESV